MRIENKHDIPRFSEEGRQEGEAEKEGGTEESC